MNRLLRIRFLVALAIVAGFSAIGIGASPSTSPVAPIQTASIVTESIPVLPTVVVSAHAPIRVLPLVIVRPTAAERQAAQTLDFAIVAAAAGGGTVDAITELLPHARLDMPYYSFGKMMPRASKD